MASIVQLKRSALSGKVPGTGSLDLGELAVNTYDGKIYFKKQGSIESVESVETTNSVITCSIRLEGTGSFGSLKVNDTLTVNHGVSVISGSLGITSDLTVLGSVNARQFNISVISSSILFQSGSTKFGDTSDDTHSFTGSMSISGGLNIQGGITGSLRATNGVISGSSQLNNTSISGLTILNPTITGSSITLELPNSNTSAVVVSSGLASAFDMRLGTTADNQYAWSTNVYYNGSSWQKDDATRSGWRMNQVVLTTDAGSGMEFNYAPVGSNSLQTLMTLRSTILDVNVPLDVAGNLIVSSGITGSIAATNGVISGSSQLTSSFDTRYALSGSSGAAAGPNTFDFNLDPEAAGTVNFIEDSTSNTRAIAKTGSFDITIGNNTQLSISASAMNVTTGSITANFMHLAKYINTAGDLDFNI